VGAGNYGQALLRVADELCTELTQVDTADLPGPRSALAEGGVLAGILDAEEESLVRELRGALVRIASALGAPTPEDPKARTIGAALDGAEMVIRGELLNGNARQLPDLMPSLVFLVTLPIVKQDRALDLSARTKDLVAQALRDIEE
jgi:hypothetical protein